MLTIEQCRKIDPDLNDLTDDELTKVRDLLYGLGQIAFDSWLAKKSGSKNPVRELPENNLGFRIKT